MYIAAKLHYVYYEFKKQGNKTEVIWLLYQPQMAIGTDTKLMLQDLISTLAEIHHEPK